MSTYWTPEELEIIDLAVAEKVDPLVLLDRLPGRSMRAIRKQFWRRGSGRRQSVFSPLSIEPEDDGEWARRRFDARIGSAKLLRRLIETGMVERPAT